MLFNLALLVIGGVLLYYGAEWFVRGAAGLAVKLGVRPLVIGLTVVSYATSAPELAVSMLAAADGKSPIALGNVVGSNITNIGLILGLTALIAPPKTDGTLISKELIVLVVGTAALPLLLLDGSIERYEGLAFCLGAFLFTYLVMRWSRSRPPDLDAVPNEVHARGTVLALLIVLGLAALLGGGKTFVDGAVGIAGWLGMSDRTIGLTVVAFGTSVPELPRGSTAGSLGNRNRQRGRLQHLQPAVDPRCDQLDFSDRRNAQRGGCRPFGHGLSDPRSNGRPSSRTYDSALGRRIDGAHLCGFRGVDRSTARLTTRPRRIKLWPCASLASCS